MKKKNKEGEAFDKTKEYIATQDRRTGEDAFHIVNWKTQKIGVVILRGVSRVDFLEMVGKLREVEEAKKVQEMGLKSPFPQNNGVPSATGGSNWLKENWWKMLLIAGAIGVLYALQHLSTIKGWFT